MQVGDKIVACNPVMDFTSVSLTVGNVYTIDEVVQGACNTFVRVMNDKGRPGLYDRNRFRKDAT